MNLEVRECIENRQMNPSLAFDMCKLSPSLNGNCQWGMNNNYTPGKCAKKKINDYIW